MYRVTILPDIAGAKHFRATNAANSSFRAIVSFVKKMSIILHGIMKYRVPQQPPMPQLVDASMKISYFDLGSFPIIKS